MSTSADKGGVYLDNCQIQPEVEAYAVDQVSARCLTNDLTEKGSSYRPPSLAGKC